MARRTTSLPAALLVAALHPCPPAGAQHHLEARWELDPSAPYVGQTFDLRLTIELDEAWSDRALVQLYPRELDIPLQTDALPTQIAGLTTGPVEGAGPTLVVDGQVVRTASVTTSEGRRRITITRSGLLETSALVRLPAPLVRFVAASGSRDDPVQGQVAIDPEEGSVLGEPLEVSARPLPEVGRPIEFTGAVGTFSLSSSIVPRALEAGSVTELTVEVSGEGALPDGAAPELVDAETAFESLGPARRDGRRFRFTLRSLRPGVERAPGARLSTFDPSSDGGAWREVQTVGPPVSVRPAASGDHDASPRDAFEVDQPIPPLPWTFFTLGAVALLAILSAIRRIAHRAAVRAAARADDES